MCTTPNHERPATHAGLGPFLAIVLVATATLASAAGAGSRCESGDGCGSPCRSHGCRVEMLDEVPCPASTTHYVEVRPGVYLAARGASERRRVRVARWAALIDGERRAVYELLGYPARRHRENFMDEITEFWTYPDEHVTFVFEGNRLLRMESY